MSRPLLAIHGGTPIRESILNYGRQSIDESDINAVVQTLNSNFLTTGPQVQQFEDQFGKLVNAPEAVAVSSGTAGLHTAMNALELTQQDEVIVPTLTFAATANCVLYMGATPVFVDVLPDTLTIDPLAVEKAITNKTKAIVAMDYAGQPCDYQALKALAQKHQLYLVTNACHSLKTTYFREPVDSLADLNVFSFHPVKPMTTGEGGMITTTNVEMAEKMRRFRNHGISVDYREREKKGSWKYDITTLGFNYRLTDIQCALGANQVQKIPKWTQRRQEIAFYYSSAFSSLPAVTPIPTAPNRTHAYHLYVVRIRFADLATDKVSFFQALRAEGIGANVHYIPVHLHPYYQDNLGTSPGMCPVAEQAYEEIISLPIFPAMSQQDCQHTVEALAKVIEAYQS